MDWADYRDYKITSVMLSVGTMGFGVGAPATAGLLKLIGKKILIELSKATVKAALSTFIEDNIGHGINNNVLGLKVLLDGVMESTEFKSEIEKFKHNCEALHEASYEKDQAKAYLNGLLKTISRKDGNSSYELTLQKTNSQLQKRLMQGLGAYLVKMALPVKNFSIGSFGSNERVIMNCADEIQVFILTTIQKLSASILGKAERLTKERQEIFHGDERPTQEEFQGIVDATLRSIRSQLRTHIADSMYESLTGLKVRQRMYDTITEGYSTILTNSRLTMTEFVEDPDAMVMTVEPDIGEEQWSVPSQICSLYDL